MSPRTTAKVSVPFRRRSGLRGRVVGLAFVAAVAGAMTWWLVERPGRPILLPDPDTTEMEPLVAQRVRGARQAVIEQPDSAEAWGRLGKVFDVHRLHAEAIPCYRRAAELAPEDFRWAYFAARVIELVSSDAEEAIEQFRVASRLRPTYAPLYVRLGDALVRQGRYDEAHEAYARAVELDASLVRAHRGLSQALLGLDDADGAVAALEATARRFPHDGATFAELARAYGRRGDRDRARAAATRARTLEEDHDLPEPLQRELADEGVSLFHCRRRAEGRIEVGDFERAIPDLMVVASLRPNESLPQRQLGLAYAETGQTDLAIQHYRKALALGASSADVHANLAREYERRRRLAEATAEFREAIRLESDHAEAHGGLGRALAKQGRLEESVVSFRRAVALTANDAHLHYNLGAALLKLADLNAALERFTAALRLDPRFANAHLGRGRTLEQLGRRAEAIAAYREAVRIDPQNAARRRLQELGIAS